MKILVTRHGQTNWNVLGVRLWGVDNEETMEKVYKLNIFTYMEEHKKKIN